MNVERFLEQLDTIVAAPQGVQRIRELVLRLAFEGKLVDQDPADEPASALLERVAEEATGSRRRRQAASPLADEQPAPLPSGWTWTTFGDIADARLGKMLDKAKNSGPLRSYLRNANVQWFRIGTADVLELRLQEDELEEYSLKTGDLLVCEGGEPGRAAVVDQEVEGMVFQKALHRVRPLGGIDVWYLAYLLRHYTWQKSLDRHFTGATIKHLTGKALAVCPVPLAPLEEQGRIVARVEDLLRLTDDVDRLLRQRDELGDRLAAAAARHLTA